MRLINKVILHCSDTMDGKDIGLKEINQWHIERGFLPSSNGISCGYHYVVRIDGLIEVARLEKDIGAHCQGHNHDSIGICLVGRGNYTSDQWHALYYLLSNILESYDLEPKHVFGHYEFDAHGKTCPIIEMDKFRDELELKLKGDTNGPACYTRFS